jgi:hypothetical protein
MIPPRCQTTLQGPDTFDAMSSQEERHTGARGFVWSSAIEDDFAIARKAIGALLEFLGVHAESAGDGFRLGFEFHRMTQIDNGKFLAGIDFLLQFFDGYARNAQFAEEAPAADEFIGEICRESTEKNDDQPPAERGRSFRNALDLAAKDVTQPEKSAAPQERAQRIKEQKTPRSHVENAGQRRRDSAEAWKKLGKDQRTSAFFRENAFRAPDAGIGLDGNLAEKLQNADASAAAKLIPERIGGDGGNRHDKERSKEIQLVGTRKRARGEQKRKRRYRHTGLLSENPREQNDVTVM